MQGYSPEEIVTDRPYLTLAQVHAALAAEEEYLRTRPRDLEHPSHAAR